MSGSPLERTLTSYLEALARKLGPQARETVDLLRREFLAGISSVARFGYATRQELHHGDAGTEILDEVCGLILAGRIPQHPAAGIMLRAVSQVAYAQLRKQNRRTQALRTTPDLDLASAPPRPGQPTVSLGNLEPILSDDSLRKCNGSVHFARAAERCGRTVRELRREAHELAAQLGHHADWEEFWLARLGESLVDMLREQTEQFVGDLLPNVRRAGAPARRLGRILARLRHCQAGNPDVLRSVRRMLKTNDFSRGPLHGAALALTRDPFPIHVIDAEWLRAQGRTDEALEALERTAPSGRAGRGARRRILVALVRSRCLEQNREYEQASNQLEGVAAVHRRDPLLTYNRHVLAHAAGLPERAAAAQADLAAIVREAPRMSPILGARIRSTLAGR